MYDTPQETATGTELEKSTSALFLNQAHSIGKSDAVKCIKQGNETVVNTERNDWVIQLKEEFLKCNG